MDRLCLHSLCCTREKRQMSILSRPIMNNSLKHVLKSFSQPCLLCGKLSSEGIWCKPCGLALPRLSAMCCPVCALPTPDGTQCGRCLKRPPAFDRTVAAFSYTFPVTRLIQALKFNHQLLIAHALASALSEHIEMLPDCIIPMPLHPARLRERGFNQSAELAKLLGARLHRPVLLNVCQRIRATRPQSSLSWKERRRNVLKAFSCSGTLAGMHVAIVDDVMTSGATLNELAQVLRNRQAREISIWVVARTLQK